MKIRKIPGILGWTLILTFFTLFMAGCATKEKNTAPAGVLLQQGTRQARAQNYLDATATFKQILEDYPDSQERVSALLLLADTLYLRKEYEEAKFNYQKFVELYPAHARVDRARFYRALCDYRMIEIESRDQTPTRNAIEQFDKIINDSPNSPYRKQAILKKKECLEKLAKNQLEIGKFYFRSGSYQSAIRRLTALLEQYPDQKFGDEAMFFLAESYYNEQNREMAEKSFNQLLQQYPRSEFARSARERLKSIR